jgi:oxysterol-binding protein-related protein 3/6/7
VQYRECYANETLIWQFKPIKKSINWAIWRKTDKVPANPSTTQDQKQSSRRRNRQSSIDGDITSGDDRKVNLREKLIGIGMEEVVPGGRCEGGQIQKGTYHVTKGGMYALVFGISGLRGTEVNRQTTLSR